MVYDSRKSPDTLFLCKMNDPTDLLIPVKKSEAGEISRMAHEIWPVVYREMISKEQTGFMLDWMYRPDRILSEIESGVRYFWIQPDGRRLGFTSFGPVLKGEVCQLHKLYIHPSFHRKGFGISSLRAIEKRLTACGATALELRVNRRNQAAIALYRKAKFQLLREDIKEIGGDFVMDDFILQKPL